MPTHYDDSSDSDGDEPQPTRACGAGVRGAAAKITRAGTQVQAAPPQGHPLPREARAAPPGGAQRDPARLEPPPPGAGPRTSRPASPVDDDLLLSPPPPLFAEDWGARCSSPELWAHVGDLVEEADVTYAGGFPEDYSDVFGAPAAALPAF